MKPIKTGGPAFPTQEERYPDGLLSEPATYGMTLRDYFAAKAMQAMLSSPNCPMQICENELASQAYITADAMLKARSV